MGIVTKKEKILKLLLAGDKTATDIGKEIAYNSEADIIKYNLFSKELEELELKGFIKELKKGEKANEDAHNSLPYLSLPNERWLKKYATDKKQVGVTSPRKRGRPINSRYSVFDIRCIRNIYNNYASLCPEIQQTRQVIDLIIKYNPKLPYIGLKKEDYDHLQNGDSGVNANEIPFDYHREIEPEFRKKLMYSKQMFEICLFGNTSYLEKAFGDIYSLVDKINIHDPVYTGPSINRYTEKGCLASDVVFEACLFVDMLKKDECEKGIQYIESKKDLLRKSKLYKLIKKDNRLNANRPIKKFEFPEHCKKENQL